jgi:hypothetical protein
VSAADHADLQILGEAFERALVLHQHRCGHHAAGLGLTPKRMVLQRLEVLLQIRSNVVVHLLNQVLALDDRDVLIDHRAGQRVPAIGETVRKFLALLDQDFRRAGCSKP